MVKFETHKDLYREEKAINFFCRQFDFTYRKLNEFDIDYLILNKEGRHIANAEVKGRIRTIEQAYPLPVAVRKLVKLSDSTSNPIMIWTCEDGIIFAKLKNLKGQIKWGGRVPREGSTNDMELMAFYNKQEGLIEMKF
jgi:hypothetical protein